jgi:hypothetical protein
MGRFLFVLVVTLSSCTPPAQKVIPVSEEQALLAKLDAYYTCIQDHAPMVLRMADSYRAREGVMRIHPTVDNSACFLSINLAKQQPPIVPALDHAADEFRASLIEVEARTADTHASRDQVIAAFDSFERAEASLFDKVFDENLRIRTKQLDEREASEGRSYDLLRERLMVEAGAVVRFAHVRATTLDKLDIVNLGNALSTFDAFVDEVTSAANRARSAPDPQDEGAVKISPQQLAGYERLERSARAFVVATRELMRRTTDHIGFDPSQLIQLESGGEQDVVGTPAAVIEAYNALVGAYYAG